MKYLDFDSINEATKKLTPTDGPCCFKVQKKIHINTFVERNNQNLGEAASGLFAQGWKLVKFQNTKKFFNKESSWESPRDQTLRCFRTYPSTPLFTQGGNCLNRPPTWQAGCRHEPTKEPSSVRLLTCTSQAWRFRSFEKMRAQKTKKQGPGDSK